MPLLEEAISVLDSDLFVTVLLTGSFPINSQSFWSRLYECVDGVRKGSFTSTTGLKNKAVNSNNSTFFEGSRFDLANKNGVPLDAHVGERNMINE